MIDKHFIDSAVEIRKEWVRLLRSLDGHQLQVDKAQRAISEKKQEVEAFSKKDLSLKDPQVKEFVEKVFNEIEYQANIIESKIKPLNDDIENLKKEELRLYRNIKQIYPDIPDESIKSQIWEHIKDINP
jgi:predicted  nucleic acid-binding Zn-ribbon protein